MKDMIETGIGHNGPPPYDLEIVDALAVRVRELADAGNAWLELGAIETEEAAGKLSDFLSQARTSIKDIEAARKEAKKPHDDAAKAVDAKFKTLSAPIEAVGVKLKAMLTAFADEKQRKLDEQKRLEREEAARKEAEAERLRKEAEKSGDVIAKAEAEAAADEAEKAQKQASKAARAQIASGTGGGRTMALRTAYRADIGNMNRAFSFFRDHPIHGEKLRAVFVQMAEAEHRSREGVKDIPGVTFTEERNVA